MYICCSFACIPENKSKREENGEKGRTDGKKEDRKEGGKKSRLRAPDREGCMKERVE